MGFPRQEYWSGLPFPSPGNLPDPGIELSSPVLAVRFFTTVKWEKLSLQPNVNFKVLQTPGEYVKLSESILWISSNLRKIENHTHQHSFTLFPFVSNILKIYLAVPALSCSTWDLILCLGSNPGPWPREFSVLDTAPPVKSLFILTL